MKVMIVDGEYRHNFSNILDDLGLEVVDSNPDVIITYGGDGTLLGAERDHPGIPKYPIRSGPGDESSAEIYRRLLENLKKGKFLVRRYFKIQFEFGDVRLTALNDIAVAQEHHPASLRYKIWINDIEYPNEIVGDGIVVATVFGSTAYYRSITHSTFQLGLGLAFNNSTEHLHHQVLREDAVIRIRITRGPAQAFADNDPRRIRLGVGDTAIIRKSSEEAVIWGLENLRSANRSIYPFSIIGGEEYST